MELRWGDCPLAGGSHLGKEQGRPESQRGVSRGLNTWVDGGSSAETLLALIPTKAPGIFHLHCTEKGADLSKLVGGRARESLELRTLDPCPAGTCRAVPA